MTPTRAGAFMLRRLTLAEMNTVAVIHRASFDERLPWLTGLHTPEEDRAFFRDRVFPANAVWGALDMDALIGFVAFGKGWINHLYVVPAAQGRGAGTALLGVAQASSPRLQLWMFQRNARACRFYERRGFVLVRETDGARNEENEPDALYAWTRA